MNDKQWVSKLDWIRRILRKDYLFIKKSQSSYYYLDRNHQYVIFPVASIDTGRVERLPPKFLEVTEDYSVKELNEVSLVTERFFKYMEQRNFSL